MFGFERNLKKETQRISKATQTITDAGNTIKQIKDQINDAIGATLVNADQDIKIIEEYVAKKKADIQSKADTKVAELENLLNKY